MKKTYALFPVIIFLMFFILDKVFLIKELQFLTQEDATFLYYQYKNELLKKLMTDYEKKKSRTLLIFGSSRLMFIDYLEFKKIYKDWELYNFSVPVNSPAYYLYYIEKIINYNIKPDLIILESDPYQFNEYSPGFKKSNLPYTFDLSFVIRYFSLFERDEVSSFLGYMLFAGKRYPPNLIHFFERLKNQNHHVLRIFKETDQYQRENHGCGLAIIPFNEWYIRDISEIEASAESTIKWLYANYKESPRQWKFFENTIHLLKKNHISFIVIKPQVSFSMERMILENQILKEAYYNWEDKIQNFIPRTQFIDFSRTDYACNTFVDGSHMSRECYDPMLFEILINFENRNE